MAGQREDHDHVPFSDGPDETGPWAGEMMAEGNGAPTLGELGRRLQDLAARIALLDSKIERYANLAVDARLGEFDRRLSTVETIQRTGATQRSTATWQVLFLVLGVLGSLAVGVVLALVFGGK